MFAIQGLSISPFTLRDLLNFAAASGNPDLAAEYADQAIRAGRRPARAAALHAVLLGGLSGGQSTPGWRPISAGASPPPAAHPADCQPGADSSRARSSRALVARRSGAAPVRISGAM